MHPLTYLESCHSLPTHVRYRLTFHFEQLHCFTIETGFFETR